MRIIISILFILLFLSNIYAWDTIYVNGQKLYRIVVNGGSETTCAFPLVNVDFADLSMNCTCGEYTMVDTSLTFGAGNDANNNANQATPSAPLKSIPYAYDYADDTVPADGTQIVVWCIKFGTFDYSTFIGDSYYISSQLIIEKPVIFISNGGRLKQNPGKNQLITSLVSDSTGFIGFMRFNGGAPEPDYFSKKAVFTYNFYTVFKNTISNAHLYDNDKNDTSYFRNNYIYNVKMTGIDAWKSTIFFTGAGACDSNVFDSCYSAGSWLNEHDEKDYNSQVKSNYIRNSYFDDYYINQDAGQDIYYNDTDNVVYNITGAPVGLELFARESGTDLLEPNCDSAETVPLVTGSDTVGFDMTGDSFFTLFFNGQYPSPSVPTISFSHPADNHDTTQKLIKIDGVTTDATDHDSVGIYVNGVYQDTVEVSSDAWSGTASLTGLGDSVQVKFWDGTNINWDTITVNYYSSIDISINAPSDNHDTNTQIIIVSGTTVNCKDGDTVQLYLYETSLEHYEWRCFDSHNDGGATWYNEANAYNDSYPDGSTKVCKESGPPPGNHSWFQLILTSAVTSNQIRVWASKQNYMISDWECTISISSDGAGDPTNWTEIDTELNHSKNTWVEIDYPEQTVKAIAFHRNGDGDALYLDEVQISVLTGSDTVHSIATISSNAWSGTVALSGIGDSITARLNDSFGRMDEDTITVNYSTSTFNYRTIKNVTQFKQKAYEIYGYKSSSSASTVNHICKQEPTKPDLRNYKTLSGFIKRLSE